MATLVKPTVQTKTVAPIAPKPEQSFWPIVGKAWINGVSNGKQLLTLKFGGNTQNPMGTLSLTDNDRLVLRQNLNQREGKRDADYDICLPPQE